MRYPHDLAPELFREHIGQLTVELVLAAVEIATLIVHAPPTLHTLEAVHLTEPFPGQEPEGMGVDSLLKLRVEPLLHTKFALL
jgi:hypothetical protein